MAANVSAVIDEYVQPIAKRYIADFDVKAWLATRPDVQELLERAKSDGEAAGIIKEHLQPYVEGLVDKVAPCACKTYPTLHDPAPKDTRAYEVSDLQPIGKGGMAVYIRPVEGRMCLNALLRGGDVTGQA